MIQQIWETEAVDDRLPDKVLHFGFNDVGKMFSFYIFHEVVDSYK